MNHLSCLQSDLINHRWGEQPLFFPQLPNVLSPEVKMRTQPAKVSSQRTSSQVFSVDLTRLAAREQLQLHFSLPDFLSPHPSDGESRIVVAQSAAHMSHSLWCSFTKLLPNPLQIFFFASRWCFFIHSVQSVVYYLFFCCESNVVRRHRKIRAFD